MKEVFKNIVRLPSPHTARSYSELTPVYKADEVAKTIASFEAELAKADEIISECWRLVGNDVDSKSALPESVNSLNERVNELEEENDLMMTRLMAAALGLASGKSCPTAIEELNKFAIEQQIEALAHVLSSYKTQKFCPTNYAIQAFNDGVAHLWAHIVNCELQLRKEQDK